MKGLDIPIVITPTLTLPRQEGEGNSRVSRWALVNVLDEKDPCQEQKRCNREPSLMDRANHFPSAPN
jgi:hypothetical protein